MRIAIITVQRVTNYGALLQAFASRHVLSKYGEVNVVDYENPYLTSHMHLIRYGLSTRGVKMFVHDIFNIRNRLILIKKFTSFINEHLALTQRVNSEDLENGVLDGYDFYVSGSDQIWNPKIINQHNEIDPIYFLSFVRPESNKISYASSMGNYEFSSLESTKVKDFLNDFKAISVREKEGVDYLNGLFKEKTITQVLDPTLLLTKNNWLSVFKVKESNYLVSDNYILVYSVPRTKLLRKAILFFANKFNMPVIAIDKMLQPMQGVSKSIRSAGPEEFISLFTNANFIITDSFHGTCFSVNFEKPFVCIPATKKANRQEGLLGALGLMDRIIYQEKDFGNITDEIDYELPSAKLTKLREQSLSYLESALG